MRTTVSVWSPLLSGMTSFHGAAGIDVTAARTSCQDSLKPELENAKGAIQAGIDLGWYQAAKEIKTEVIKLGDSSQQALWSQYELTSEGMTKLSEIYLWTHANTIFKLRCTVHSEQVTSNQVVLKPLQTAFGSSPLQSSQ